MNLTLNDLFEFLKQVNGERSFTEPVLVVGEDEVRLIETIKEIAREIAEEQRKKYVEYSREIAEKTLFSPDEFFVVHTALEGDLLQAEVLSMCAGFLLSDLSETPVFEIPLQVVLEREIGSLRLNENLTVIIAGDEETAIHLPLPLLARSAVFRAKNAKTATPS